MSAEKAQTVIDIHTHVFNALCLPLEGIILEYLDESLNPMTPYRKKTAAKALAKLIEQLAGSRRFAGVRTGPNWLTSIDEAESLTALVELLSKPIFDEFSGEMYKNRRLVAHDLRREDGFAAAFDWVVMEFGDPVATKDYPVLNTLEGLRELDGKSLVRWEEPWSEAIRKFLHTLFSVGERGEGYLRFLCLLLAPQRTIIDRLFRSYSKLMKSNGVNVQLFIHLMMDMEKAYLRYWWSRPPVWDYPTMQVPQMIEFHKELAGRALWFVAFDPRRNCHYGTPSGIETVKSALSQGACGVKFYPSLGYKPADNDDKWIQDAVTELLMHCKENGIPILAHCQRGPFKGDDTWDQFSDPHLWEKALVDHENLILCLAHAGGGIDNIGKGWFSKDPDEWNNESHWAKKVVDLCCKYPNVCCDLSAMWEVIDAPLGLDPPAPERFARTLKWVLDENPGFDKKIMYGSDWHMPSALGRSPKYLAFFRELFKDTEPDLTHNFFFNNARRFLRLNHYVEANKNNLTKEAYKRLKALANMP